MAFNFQSIQVPFTDFCILALLLGVMYSVSAFEAWLTPKGKRAIKNSESSKMNRIWAASYAFFGILLTLAAGVVSEANTGEADILFLIVPLFFIGHWALFHLRSSDLIDPEIVRDLLAQDYRDAVIHVFATRAQESFSADEVRTLALESSFYVNLLLNSRSLYKSVVPMPMREAINSLIPTPEKTYELLNSLESDGLIQSDGKGKFKIKTNCSGLGLAR